SAADYAKRMELELARPLTLFQTHLGRRSETLAFPYGDADEELLQNVVQQGYVGAFTVRRQSNPAFVFPLRINRSQIYAEMTLDGYAKSLQASRDEPLQARASREASGAAATNRAVVPAQSAGTAAATAALGPERLAALHDDRGEELEARGHLRSALEERAIALTINPRHRRAQQAHKRLEARIAQDVADLLKEGRDLLGRGLLGEAPPPILTSPHPIPPHLAPSQTPHN